MLAHTKPMAPSLLRCCPCQPLLHPCWLQGGGILATMQTTRTMRALALCSDLAARLAARLGAPCSSLFSTRLGSGLLVSPAGSCCCCSFGLTDGPPLPQLP